MSTVSSNVDAAAAHIAPARGFDWWNVALWLTASLLTAFFALIVRDSTIVDGMYLPRGNDSFYHARRILDAAVGSRGFYQFDDRLQVPDGAWISWPWAYDYLMAKVAQLGVWLVPGLDPMAVISYVPVFWILVNAALFLAASTEIGLSREMRALAMLCFALSPLTQLLHSIGMIDHHYVEHTFVLLAIWLGLRWFKNPTDHRAAALLAFSLGAAPAFHNGLFILQLLPLVCVFVLWIRGSAPPASAIRAFSIALLITTAFVVLPSEPLRRGMFEFGLLSWFHVYIAVCTSAALTIMATWPYSRKRLGRLAAACALLAIPLATQLGAGAGFLSGKFSILDEIVEVRSPYKLFTDTYGPVETASHYSWLLLLAPALLIYFAYRVFRERDPGRLYYAIVVTFGLALLLDQLRLHYFGFFGFITGGLLLLDELRHNRRWHRGATFVAALATIVLAYQPALRERLFIVYAPGADTEYASAFAIFLDLRELCAQNPGVVLASPDDGSAILFHSECSVIANNFILRTSDAEHIDEVGRLMRMAPAEIRRARPDIKYLFVRVRDFSLLDGNVARLVEDSPIAKQLFIDEAAPPGFELIKTVRRRIGEDGPAGIYARLYRVLPERP